MGGGVGMSAHAAHRIVTERSAVAMPEVGIGFFPDVGVSFFLARSPGAAGAYLALTGKPHGCRRRDLLRACRQPYSRREGPCRDAGGARPIAAAQRRSRVASPARCRRCPRQTCGSAGHGSTAASRRSGRGHRRSARRAAAGEAATALAAMGKMSPTSLKVTLRNFRDAAAFEEVEKSFQQDYRIALACIAGHDFIEGIRATICRQGPQAGVAAGQNRRRDGGDRRSALPIRRRTANWHIRSWRRPAMAQHWIYRSRKHGRADGRQSRQVGRPVWASTSAAARARQQLRTACRSSPSARPRVEDADIVVSMLPAGEHVLSVWKDVVPHARKGALFIDCSTIDVATRGRRRPSAAAPAWPRSTRPVSGGVGGAKAATLTFMVGGSSGCICARPASARTHGQTHRALRGVPATVRSRKSATT